MGVNLLSQETIWPKLWELVVKGAFAKIDYFLAEKIAKKTPLSLSAACLLMTLAAASRLGHLCLKIEKGRIIPSLSEIISDPESISCVESLLQEGFSSLPSELVSIDPQKGFPDQLVCKFQNCLYLQSSYVFENKFLKELHRLLQKKEEDFSFLELPATLQNEQKEAIHLALRNPLTLITGGPGTGKTYTAAHLISAYLQLKKGQRVQIALAAPTGKAASHLEASLLKVIDPSLISIKCSTLHSLLQIKSSKDLLQDPLPLSADLVIVDECSMIEMRLFSVLLSSIKEGTKLVLMGDKDQLSPVESGSFFADLVQAAENGFSIPCAFLKTSMRSEMQDILSLAEAIKEKDSNKAISLSHQKAVQRIKLGMNAKKAEVFYAKLWEHCKEHFPTPTKLKPDPLSLLEKLENFRLLSPLRQGPFGVDALNQMFVDGFWKEMKGPAWFASPILITRNNYELGLCNGDTGILLRYCSLKKKEDKSFDEEDVAFFPEKEKASFRSIPALLLPSYEYAYCLSVHKSQGSEYDKVLLLLPQGTEVFGKEVLYTAVTRAKKALEIETEDQVLLDSLQRSSRKVSGLPERLLKKNDL